MSHWPAAHVSLVVPLAALAAAAGVHAAQGLAVPRLLQPASPPAATAEVQWPIVRTPTLAFKAAVWPLSITTAALVHGTAGWPIVKAPPLVFKAAAWPSPIAAAPLVYRGSLVGAQQKLWQVVPPVQPATPNPPLSIRSRP